MTKDTIGVDISKGALDAYRFSTGEHRQFLNDLAGCSTFIDWVREDKVDRVVFEPTGPYHRSFERALGKAGVPISKINPRHARRFAEATGSLAKTDRVDAAMLARMGMLLEPATRPIISETLDELRDLSLARQALIKDRTAAKNRQKVLRIGLLRRQNIQRLKQIEGQLTAIHSAIETLVQGNEDLKLRANILISIPGISTLTAHTLLIDMPELGTLDARQVASLAGLAPVTRESGTWKGRSFIRGGRARLRQALYMPALAACRFNPDYKIKYAQMKAAGKPSKVAITAVMRKLIVLANALIRDCSYWTPKRA